MFQEFQGFQEFQEFSWAELVGYRLLGSGV
jgi:hypothetical protein